MLMIYVTIKNKYRVARECIYDCCFLILLFFLHFFQLLNSIIMFNILQMILYKLYVLLQFLFSMIEYITMCYFTSAIYIIVRYMEVCIVFKVRMKYNMLKLCDDIRQI